MQAALSLVNITENDVDKAGYRAVDLARAQKQGHPVPLSFVIPCQVFDEFMTQSGIAAKLQRIYDDNSADREGYISAYAQLKEAFDQVSFSGELREQLIDAYESLAVPDSSSGASDLVGADPEPIVALLPSESYVHTRLDGLSQNVFGADGFLTAVKDAWLSLFVPEAIVQRQESRIASFTTAVIVQQQQKSSASALGSFHQHTDPPITIESYLGFFDPVGAITKDSFGVVSERLAIVSKKVVPQSYRLFAGEDSGELEQGSLTAPGEQSISDRAVLEVARLTKRINLLLNADLNILFAVDEEEVFPCFVIRSILQNNPASSPVPSPSKVHDAVQENEVDDLSPAEEENNYDPDKEDLGLAPAQEIVRSDADFAPVDKMEPQVIEEPVSDEPLAHEQELSVEEEPAAQAIQDPVADPELQESEFSIEQEPQLESEPESESGPEPAADEVELPVSEPAAEFPVQEQELPAEQPAQEDDTLFSLYTKEESEPAAEFPVQEQELPGDQPAQEFSAQQEPEEELSHEPVQESSVKPQEEIQTTPDLSEQQKFVRSVFEEAKAVLSKLHQEHYGRPAGNFEELVDNLQDAGALPENRDALLRLHALNEKVLHHLPSDKEVGFVWRMDAIFKQFENEAYK